MGGRDFSCARCCGGVVGRSSAFESFRCCEKGGFDGSEMGSPSCGTADLDGDCGAARVGEAPGVVGEPSCMAAMSSAMLC